MVQAINDALRVEMGRDERVVVIGEDVGRNGGVFRCTEGLQAKFGEARVMDTPLSESGIIGVSIGMAIYGLRPVAEIQFEGFIFPAMDQIINHAARIRTRSRGRYTVPLVVRSPYSGGIRALEHHSDSNEVYFVHSPGLKMVIPSTPSDAKGLLISSIRDPDPVVFYEPKRIYRAIKEEVPEGDYTVPLGQAKVVRQGSDVSLFAWGAMVRVAKEAAEKGAERGIDAEVVDLRTLSPMDEDAVLASVKKTGRAVVVQEAPRTCGVGAEVAAIIAEKAMLHLSAPVQRVTGYDTVFPLFKLEDNYLPNAAKILDAMERAMSF